MSDPVESFWAVVIGSGFGGAVTACRLAQAFPERARTGQIAILERGRRYGREDFPRIRLPDYLTSDPEKLTSKRVPDVARVSWANDDGLWELRNLGELRAGVAAGYGGGSLIYANVHLRAPESVFEKWPSYCEDRPCRCVEACQGATPPEYKKRAQLDPYYDRVAYMLDIKPLPENQRARYPKTAAFRRAADKLGSRVQHMYPPLAITFDEPKDGKNRWGQEQHACTGCGNCVIGCQEGAKNTLDLNYLAEAERLGLVVRTLTEVKSIAGPTGGLYRLDCIDHLLGNKELPLAAQYVFLCAGALGSTEILLRSAELTPAVPLPIERKEETTEDVKDERTKFFANGDNLAVVFDTDEALDPSHGPTITTSLLHVAEPTKDNPAPWFLLQDGGMPRSLIEGFGIFRSPYWMARNRFTPPGFVARRAPPPALSDGALSALDHLIENTALAFDQGKGGPARPDPMPEQALVHTAGLIQPKALDGLVNRLAQAEALGRQELREVIGDILRRVDAQLDAGIFTPLLKPLRALVVDLDGLVDMTAASLAERYPVLAGLLAGQGSAGIARFLITAVKELLFCTWSHSHSAVLLAMGPDRPGVLSIVKHGTFKDRLRARWDQDQSLPLFTLQERLMRDIAAELNGELRTNPDWTIGRVPLTDHAQGGLRMGKNAAVGFTKPCGQVWGHEGLYVMDAAPFFSSVGVNPSSTIAAVAERNIELFIKKKKGTLPEAEYARATQFAAGKRFADAIPPAATTTKPFSTAPRAQPLGVTWREKLEGTLCFPPESDQDFMRKLTDDFMDKKRVRPEFDPKAFVRAARKGRLASVFIEMNLRGVIDDLEAFMVEPHPQVKLESISRPGDPPRADVSIARGEYKGHYRVAEGSLRFEMDSDEPPARSRSASRFWAEERAMVAMTYHVVLDGMELDGQPRPSVGLELVGRKKLVDETGLDAWTDLSTLFVGLREKGSPRPVKLGILRVHLGDFIRYQLRGMDTTGSLDPLGNTGAIPLDDTAKAWALARFSRLFLGTITNVYSQWI